MDERLTLHTLLTTAFPGVLVYYRPSGNITLSQPCIVYEDKPLKPTHANNTIMTLGRNYQVTFMNKLPPNDVDVTPMLYLSGVGVLHEQSFIHDDIIHDIFRIEFN